LGLLTLRVPARHVRHVKLAAKLDLTETSTSDADRHCNAHNTTAMMMKTTAIALLLSSYLQYSQAFAPCRIQPSHSSGSKLDASRQNDNDDDLTFLQHTVRAVATASLSLALLSSSFFGGPAFAESQQQNYDGFAEYAKDNQMEKSDVSCFMNKCGDQTKALFSNPRGIKGVSCLGRCKGEQSCATRCFAEYGSEDLNNWLSCTIQDNECVKVPKSVDNSAELLGYDSTVKKFDPSTLVGTWYKTDGLNPNYDLFDCQTNTFEKTGNDDSELDMGIFFRVNRPASSGGGFWENALTEHMVVDAVLPETPNPAKRTMHTAGKMYGLQFTENWYILGESDGKKDVPPFKLVAYKGHTLQGNYEGAFVYAKEPILPAAAVPAVKEAARNAGLDFEQFTRIDNTWYVAVVD